MLRVSLLVFTLFLPTLSGQTQWTPEQEAKARHVFGTRPVSAAGAVELTEMLQRDPAWSGLLRLFSPQAEFRVQAVVDTATKKAKFVGRFTGVLAAERDMLRVLVITYACPVLNPVYSQESIDVYFGTSKPVSVSCLDN